jgi:hypothetical protein
MDSLKPADIVTSRLERESQAWAIRSAGARRVVRPMLGFAASDRRDMRQRRALSGTLPEPAIHARTWSTAVLPWC